MYFGKAHKFRTHTRAHADAALSTSATQFLPERPQNISLGTAAAGPIPLFFCFAYFVYFAVNRGERLASPGELACFDGVDKKSSIVVLLGFRLNSARSEKEMSIN
jgi:hypothetical protein